MPWMYPIGKPRKSLCRAFLVILGANVRVEGFGSNRQQIVLILTEQITIFFLIRIHHELSRLILQNETKSLPRNAEKKIKSYVKYTFRTYFSGMEDQTTPGEETQGSQSNDQQKIHKREKQYPRHLYKSF